MPRASRSQLLSCSSLAPAKILHCWPCLVRRFSKGQVKNREREKTVEGEREREREVNVKEKGIKEREREAKILHCRLCLVRAFSKGQVRNMGEG